MSDSSSSPSSQSLYAEERIDLFQNWDVVKHDYLPSQLRLPAHFFDGRIIMPDEIERMYKEVLKYERIEAVSVPMRKLIEDLGRNAPKT